MVFGWIIDQPGITSIAEGKRQALLVGGGRRSDDRFQGRVENSSMRDYQVIAGAVADHLFHRPCRPDIDFPFAFTCPTKWLVGIAKSRSRILFGCGLARHTRQRTVVNLHPVGIGLNWNI